MDLDENKTGLFCWQVSVSQNKRRLLGPDLDLEVCSVRNAILVYIRNKGRTGGPLLFRL